MKHETKTPATSQQVAPRQLTSKERKAVAGGPEAGSGGGNDPDNP